MEQKHRVPPAVLNLCMGDTSDTELHTIGLTRNSLGQNETVSVTVHVCSGRKSGKKSADFMQFTVKLGDRGTDGLSGKSVVESTQHLAFY